MSIYNSLSQFKVILPFCNVFYFAWVVSITSDICYKSDQIEIISRGSQHHHNILVLFIYILFIVVSSLPGYLSGARVPLAVNFFVEWTHQRQKREQHAFNPSWWDNTTGIPGIVTTTVSDGRLFGQMYFVLCFSSTLVQKYFKKVQVRSTSSYRCPLKYYRVESTHLGRALSAPKYK